jgi:hypothetical protein
MVVERTEIGLTRGVWEPESEGVFVLTERNADAEQALVSLILLTWPGAAFFLTIDN